MPAITPWQGDVPQFALTDRGRSADCALERLCSVCGRFMERRPAAAGGDDGPVGPRPAAPDNRPAFGADRTGKHISRQHAFITH
ncbi:hypothetical protein [Kitasatospora sp. NPDC001095]